MDIATVHLSKGPEVDRCDIVTDRSQNLRFFCASRLTRTPPDKISATAPNIHKTTSTLPRHAV